MKTKASFSLIVASTMLLSACSFQKDPDKKAPATPAPVKIGMTKEELQQEILKSSDIAFPDKLLLAAKKEDKDLVYRLLREATSKDLNEYGVGGFTAMELLIKSGEDSLFLDALSKGGSLYKFRKGTKYRIYSILDDSPNNFLDLSKEAIPKADEKMRKDAVYSLMSPSTFLSNYWETNYPVLRVVEGKTVLESIKNFKAGYIDISLRYERVQSWAPLLKLIEDTEGPITNGVFELLLFFVEIRDPYSVQYLKDKIGVLSAEQRQQLLQSVTYPTVEWLLDLNSIISFSEDEFHFLESKTIKELELIEAKKLKAIRANFNRWDVNEYTAKNLPRLYSFLNDKFKGIDGKVDDRAAGIGSNAEFRSFSYRNLYEALMEDDTSEYQRCLTWYDKY
ncbi:hypothetical protein [Bdellovibrio sp. BCCA]|uniref:hypothetical protein n=1 Tax=Bdellovibrio sp. BCCA TaxID=3136281 RepID=UPI0030F1701C